MTRRIVQITASAFGSPEGGRPMATLYGLCDDGSLWESDQLRDQEWRRLPDIPQDTPERSDPDPIAELEAMGGRMVIADGSLWCVSARAARVPREQIVWPFTVDAYRAAAARLLARIGGAR